MFNSFPNRRYLSSFGGKTRAPQSGVPDTLRPQVPARSRSITPREADELMERYTIDPSSFGMNLFSSTITILYG